MPSNVVLEIEPNEPGKPSASLDTVPAPAPSVATEVTAPHFPWDIKGWIELRALFSSSCPGRTAQVPNLRECRGLSWMMSVCALPQRGVVDGPPSYSMVQRPPSICFVFDL